jgi:hypothetical protein
MKNQIQKKLGFGGKKEERKKERADRLGGSAIAESIKKGKTKVTTLSAAKRFKISQDIPWEPYQILS